MAREAKLQLPLIVRPGQSVEALLVLAQAQNPGRVIAETLSMVGGSEAAFGRSAELPIIRDITPDVLPQQ